jgi:hypothetical protein
MASILAPLNAAAELTNLKSGAVWRSGTGVPPGNHAHDACATFQTALLTNLLELNAR